MSDVIVIVTSVLKTVVFFNINICCFIILNGILAAYGAICSNVPVMADNLNFSTALPPSVMFWDINFLVKTDPVPEFRSLCQILRESVHKWHNYHRITDFKMAASAILDFCI